jgi:hypothetical protein
MCAQSAALPPHLVASACSSSHLSALISTALQLSVDRLLCHGHRARCADPVRGLRRSELHCEPMAVVDQHRGACCSQPSCRGRSTIRPSAQPGRTGRSGRQKEGMRCSAAPAAGARAAGLSCSGLALRPCSTPGSALKQSPQKPRERMGCATNMQKRGAPASAGSNQPLPIRSTSSKN